MERGQVRSNHRCWKEKDLAEGGMKLLPCRPRSQVKAAVSRELKQHLNSTIIVPWKGVSE